MTLTYFFIEGGWSSIKSWPVMRSRKKVCTKVEDLLVAVIRCAECFVEGIDLRRSCEVLENYHKTFLAETHLW